MSTTKQQADAALSPVFREAVTQADIAISITDPQANILYVNPAFERVTGFSAAEAIGRNQSMLSAKATPVALYADMWKKISAGHPWSGRLVNRRKDGGEYLADLLITPVLDAQGRISHYLGIHRDITAVHRLECQVNNQKALIESVVDAAPLAIALLDGEDCVVLDNHEYKKLMGDLGMAEPASLILDAVRANLGHGIGPAREGALAFADREIRIDPPGHRPARWFSCSGAWVKSVDEGTEAFFGRQDSLYLLLIAKEITQQRAQQEKARMAALMAMMAEENRIGGLRESLSAALFQMEGLLNVVGSVVAMLQRRGQHDSTAAALGEAVRAGEKALETLRRAIPEPSGEAAAATNLNEILRDVLDLSTGRLLAAGVTVSWKPQAVLPTIQGYPIRLRALFKALIDNALEAMNTKGWLARELTLITRTRPEGVEVVVEDSGPGIAPELHLKVFEPFFTTKPRHSGTGLAMAQQIVADHGGTIEIDPRHAAGCRLRVVLPVGAGEAAR
ncbi:nitrogen fixation negative regulator NifL [Caldichromatium japonicum]|uniref:histidine kinase n=1 Tax=Caldichromatium japonicum TaxID=2699430 RepID=A0A6G7VFB5_9GAMM|nr:nitrogen fixation negative regulator NifL [Caldichromatium japonicum]QIK38548.1 nitrogen fixation negative regulator NifL [Caldichromatium japonicum]